MSIRLLGGFQPLKRLNDMCFASNQYKFMLLSCFADVTLAVVCNRLTIFRFISMPSKIVLTLTIIYERYSFLLLLLLLAFAFSVRNDVEYVFHLPILLQFFTSLVISAVTGFQATINSSNFHSEMIIYFYCFCILT